MPEFSQTGVLIETCTPFQPLVGSDLFEFHPDMSGEVSEDPKGVCRWPLAMDSAGDVESVFEFSDSFIIVPGVFVVFPVWFGFGHGGICGLMEGRDKISLQLVYVCGWLVGLMPLF